MKQKWIVWAVITALCLTLAPAAFAAEEPAASGEYAEIEAGLSEEAVSEADESASEDAAPALDGELTQEAEEQAAENHFSARPSEETTDYGLVLVPYGESAVLTVEVFADDASRVTYQWYRYYPDSWFSILLSRVRIPSATDASYTVSDVRAAAEYICVVKDGYGGEETVYFTVKIDSGLRAWVAGDEYEDGSASYMTEKGASITLAVSSAASEDAMPLSYKWSCYDGRMGASVTVEEDADTYVVPEVTRTVEYDCVVKDQYGNQVVVCFYISVDNHFVASAERDVVIVSEGEEGRLCVIASADEGELAYQWFREVQVYDEDWGQYFSDREILEGETSPELIVTDVEEAVDYLCDVTDPYETMTVCVRVEPENGLYARAKGTESEWATVHVPLNETAVLEVDAYADRGGLSYRWEENGMIDELEETGPRVTTPEVTDSLLYTCTVTDMYGGERQVRFSVFVEDHLFVEADGEYEEAMERLYPSDTEETAVYCVRAKPGDTVTLAARIESDSGVETGQWYRLYDTVEGETDPVLTLENVQEDEIFYFEAVNRYNEWAGVYFKVIVSGDGAQFDPLDVTRDGRVDAWDAAGLLAGGYDLEAAAALRRAVGLA